MRWAFWRSPESEPERALPDGIGLPTRSRGPAAPMPPEPDDAGGAADAPQRAGATPTATPDPNPTVRRHQEPSLTAAADDVDRTAVAATGEQLAKTVRAVRTSTRPDTSVEPEPTDPAGDPRVLAVAATGALAARLPALSGIDAAAGSGEPQEELLHAYVELLVARTQTLARADREDLLAVAHLAAAAAAVEASADPSLLLLAGVSADVQLRAAALLLAQTADDGAGPPEHLGEEVRALFSAAG